MSRQPLARRPAALLQKTIGDPSSGAAAEAPAPTEGSSDAVVNSALMAMIGLVTGATGVAFCCLPAQLWGKGRPQPWVVALLIASYALLIPGLIGILFSFKISLNIMGEDIVLTSVKGTPGPITESFFGFVRLMLDTGGYLGAILVIIYAMIIPALKLVFLFIGEFWRYSQDKGKLSIARNCIWMVQLVSKWACPDLFAYIFLYYLMRHINGGVITAVAHLDIGFTSFALFCICSTISTLSIKLPEVESAATGTGRQSSWLLSRFGREGVGMAAVVAACAIFVSFGLGMVMPCMGLRLNTNLFVQPNGPLPALAKPALDILDLGSMVNADVSLVSCITTIWEWLTHKGELNCMLAFVLLAGFVIVLTVLDVLALVAAAFSLRRSGGTNWAMQASKVLRHVSMLDVCIMGVIVVCAAAIIYQKMGVTIFIMPGLWVLMVAEVLHYVLYYSVSSAVEAAAAPIFSPAP